MPTVPISRNQRKYKVANPVKRKPTTKCLIEVRNQPLEAFKMPRDSRKWRQASRSRFSVLEFLASFADGDGNCGKYSPDVERQMKRHGFTRQWLYRILDDLHELGFLNWARSNRHEKRFYTITLPDVNYSKDSEVKYSGNPDVNYSTPDVNYSSPDVKYSNRDVNSRVSSDVNYSKAGKTASDHDSTTSLENDASSVFTVLKEPSKEPSKEPPPLPPLPRGVTIEDVNAYIESRKMKPSQHAVCRFLELLKTKYGDDPEERLLFAIANGSALQPTPGAFPIEISNDDQPPDEWENDYHEPTDDELIARHREVESELAARNDVEAIQRLNISFKMRRPDLWERIKT